MKLEHIGIAVKNLSESDSLFEKLMGKSSYKHESVASEAVTTSFYEAGTAKLELLAGENEDSAITKYLAKNREGIHHIAFSTEDIYGEIERLKKLGFQFINETPKEGADNKLIVFLHPKSTNGVLIELCMEKKFAQ